MTIDPLVRSDRESADRELFDRIAADYAAKDRHRACSPARRHRALATMRLLSSPAEARGRVLEVGCGAGYAAAYLEGTYDEYVGLDYSAGLIEAAERLNAAPHRSYTVANAVEYEPTEKFDVVYMVGVLHHLDDPAGDLVSIARLVRPGGWVVVNEPQPDNPLVTALRWVRKRVDRSYSADQVELAVHEIRALFTGAGLTEISTRSQGFLSTPFAEVPLGPIPVTSRLSRLAVRADEWLERRDGWLTRRLAWNVIAAGRVSEASD